MQVLLDASFVIEPEYNSQGNALRKAFSLDFLG
jgi:hypothetical protein